MQHLAFIMDGNRRWAKSAGVAATQGHKHGKEAARLAIDFCIKTGIKYLSLYTFSLENFSRPQIEQDVIFSILIESITRELDQFLEQGVRLRFVGDRSKFPAHLREAIESAQEQTKDLDTLHLNLLFCYGGQQELVHAVKAIASQVAAGELALGDIDHDTVSNALWTAGVPNPDLIVRTSGVSRLSNFLLYQAAYSELAFLDCHWPEITEAHLQKCFDDFRTAKRSYGA